MSGTAATVTARIDDCVRNGNVTFYVIKVSSKARNYELQKQYGQFLEIYQLLMYKCPAVGKFKFPGRNYLCYEPNRTREQRRQAFNTLCRLLTEVAAAAALPKEIMTFFELKEIDTVDGGGSSPANEDEKIDVSDVEIKIRGGSASAAAAGERDEESRLLSQDCSVIATDGDRLPDEVGLDDADYLPEVGIDEVDYLHEVGVDGEDFLPEVGVDATDSQHSQSQSNVINHNDNNISNSSNINDNSGIGLVDEDYEEVVLQGFEGIEGMDGLEGGVDGGDDDEENEYEFLERTLGGGEGGAEEPSQEDDNGEANN